ENIFRHLEMGEPPEVAAEKGGAEVALPVLAATLTTVVVFFPVTFLYGVSRYLFSALALSVVLSLFASFFVAMTVVPLFCAKLIKGHQNHGATAEHTPPQGWFPRFNAWFNRKFHNMLDGYEKSVNVALLRPLTTVLGITGFFVLSLGFYPLIGKAYFPRTDPGQFVIDMKAPTGTRIEMTESLVARVEKIVHQVVRPKDLKIIVSNIGTTPGFNSILNPNSCPSTAVVQVGLNDGHLSSFDYMQQVRSRLERELPEVSTYFQTGGLVDAILNLGMPAPLDIQVSSHDKAAAHDIAVKIAQQVRQLPGVSDVLVPQDMDYPALMVEMDRERVSELGITAQEVVDSLITALTSNGMIAPSYWIDPKSGNPFLLTVQYPEDFLQNLADLGSMPLRAPELKQPTRLDTVVRFSHILAPSEVDHYQVRPTIDVYVAPSSEDLSHVYAGVQKIVDQTTLPKNMTITVRGSVQAMRESFKSFGLGLILSTLLVYLILVAQFRSFLDPFLILLAVPTGLTGVLLILWLTDTTLNVMSLMGVIMMVGIVVSNSILIVEFTHRLIQEGSSVREAVALACRVRLRPVLMTSLATLIGLIPMATKLGTGSEAYAPLARAIIGGLAVSVVLTVFIVPAAFLLFYRHKPPAVLAGNLPTIDPGVSPG
ncbi:MAG: efflux RND transporter permease subunit, partial [Verrucomicrobia bacterium]|nr:efflux RND transporter permease subunit [Verrucomicrobiota bacterium]